MKCSLLTLSTFIDGELAPQRCAEVDAHLVGCTRCSAGAATLREEKTRIGHLARVSVDPASAQLMLEQVGISIESAADLPPAAPLTPPPADAQRPWQGGTRSSSLPWTPHRPDRMAPISASQGIVAPPIAPDVPPDLPLDGVRSVPPSWSKEAPDVRPAPVPVEDITPVVEDIAAAVEDTAPAVDLAPVVEDIAPVGEDSAPRGDTATVHHSPPPQEPEWADADEEWLNGATPTDAWEADLPPPAEAGTAPAMTSAEPNPPPAVQPVTPPLPAAAPEPSFQTPPPTRVAAASGPAALWARIHDAVSVRLALSRGGDAIEDSVQIISGAPTRRGAQLPIPESVPPPPSGIVAAPPTPPFAAPVEQPSDVELNGFAGTPHAAPEPVVDVLAEPVADDPVDRRYRDSAPVIDDRDSAQRSETAGWNAFAASSYPELEIPGERPVEQKRPRPLGRHSRAVAREQVALSTRVGRGMSAVAVAVRTGTGGAISRARQGVRRVASTGPDNRLLAGIAGIGLIFVIALIIGHGSSRPTTPTATRPGSTAAPPQTHQSAPAQSSAAAATGVPPAPARVQTYGAGDTGFRVIRLRYGAQTSYMRVVFDLGAATAGALGSPKVTVSFSSPTTMLVTFNGTVPAGSTGTPTPGKVISSVSLVSSSGGKTVYRFGLTRAATATAFYLASPTRFVLDVH